MSFEEFQSLESQALKQSSNSNPLLQKLLNIMNPPWWQVIARLFLLQSASAIVLLALCPQFGLRTFGHGQWSLFSLFMSFGHEVCAFLCGVFFIGGGLFMSALFIDHDDWNKILKLPELPIMTLSLSFLFVFELSGGDIHLSHALIWLFGALTVSTLVLRPYQRFFRAVPSESPAKAL